METAEEIWAGDLFDRQFEAEDLVGYLQSVAARPPIREDGHAHVLAIDGQYGEGKTFFLRRFARHMHLTNPVAFVDAWVDDLEDEPLVALAATLDEALEPFLARDETLSDRLRQFRASAGRVAKIVSTGFFKRSVGFLITNTAAEALTDELAGGTDAQKDIKKDSLKSAGQGIADDAFGAKPLTPTPTMEARIAKFREGQQAIRDMKRSLSMVVERLAQLDIPIPVTIVIDELDRCRPTYAIKLLEEVKHLFDVQGVAFVLGLHSGQLEHSVRAAYGERFDAQAYLRRFFNRRYRLRPAKLQALTENLIERLHLNVNRLAIPEVSQGSGSPRTVLAREFIAAVILAYNLRARDSFQVMEMLQVAMALTSSSDLDASYLLALICSRVIGESFNSPGGDLPWQLSFVQDNGGSLERQAVSFSEYIQEVHMHSRLSDGEVLSRFDKGLNSPAMIAVINNVRTEKEPNAYARFGNYEKLLDRVRRFSNDLHSSSE